MGAACQHRSVDLRVVELLAARICHDLIGPVAAVGNGSELLSEEDAEFFHDAVALVGSSARKANGRLQFYRFAYGYAGGELAGPPPHQLVAGYFADTDLECEYGSAARGLALNQQKLACAMLALAGEGLPRGGQLALEVAEKGLVVDAMGVGAGLSPASRSALTLGATVADLTARTILAYFAGLLASREGRRLVVADRPGGFRLCAKLD